MENLTYNMDKNGWNEWQQDGIRSTVREWDRSIEPLQLKETSSKKDGDILIELQNE
jgi:hypothetical protein